MPAVVLTDHSIERYRERVKPGLGWRAALDDAHAILESCGELAGAPDWVDVCHGDLFVLVGPDIAFPIQVSRDDGETLLATTCLVRGGMSEDRREAKHRRKLKARAQRAERQRIRSLPKAARPRTA